MQLPRAEDIIFERIDGTVIVAPPVDRGQMGQALSLYRVGVESPLDLAARRGLQVEIYLRDARWMQGDRRTPAGTIDELLKKLDGEEEATICQAFTVQHHGGRPDTAVAIFQAIADIVKKNALSPVAPTRS